MIVLLTGASGFVGSHVLEVLQRAGIPTRLLLRASSSRAFIQRHLEAVTINEGSINSPDALNRAMKGVTHVVHCAGLVKALGISAFYEVNQVGTRNVVLAANAANVRRLVHVSSLAAAGPATADRPACETDVPQPVSEYGKSKLAGEKEILDHCQTEYVILRPPAVYGPRDGEFLRLFKAVKRGLIPDIGCGRQALSLVFVEDLARVVVDCLEHPSAVAETYFVNHPEVQTAVGFGRLIATELGRRAVRVPIPVPLIWPLCLGQELASRITRRANVLSLQKYAELRARGWVCDAGRLRARLGLTCPTGLAEGVRHTAAAYRDAGWL